MMTHYATSALLALLRAPVRVVQPAGPDRDILRLIALLRELGEIPAVRVSAAQARGAARRYPYWGAARYVIRLRADGMPMLVACERASSDRRSRRLAVADADALARREGRVRLDARPGGLSARSCARVLEQWRALAERPTCFGWRIAPGWEGDAPGNTCSCPAPR